MTIFGQGIWILAFALFLFSSQSREGCAMGYDPVTDKCFRCSFDYYRDSFSGETYFPTSECKKRDNERNYSRSVWISNYTCGATSPCDGTMENPFDNLPRALLSIYKESNPFLFSTIKFYFLYQDHYVLIMNFGGLSYSPYLFYNLIANIEFSPWFCDMGSAAGCLSTGERVKINIKTNEFYLFFSHKMVWSNFIFDGTDIHIQTAKLTTGCYNKKQTCCTSDKIVLTRDVCFLYKKSYKESKILNNFGLFNNDWIPDSGIPDLLPNLIINFCEFRNMYLICNKNVGFFSLFKLINTPLKISVINVIFTNVYFEYGIVYQRRYNQYFDLPLVIQQEARSSLLVSGNSLIKYNSYLVTSSSLKTIYDFFSFPMLDIVFTDLFMTLLGNYNEKTVKTFIFNIVDVGSCVLSSAQFDSLASHFFLSALNTDMTLADILFSSMSIRIIPDYPYFEIVRGKTTLDNIVLQGINFVMRRNDYFVFNLRNTFVAMENFYILDGNSFCLYLPDTTIYLKSFIIERHVSYYSIFYFYNTFFDSKELKLIGFQQNYTDFLSNHVDNPQGTILKIEGWFFLKVGFVSPYETRILNWPKSHPIDKILINNLLIDQVLEPQVSFIKTIKMFYMEFENINLARLQKDFEFIDIYDFSFLKIKNFTTSESRITIYIIALICEKCYMSFDGIAIKNTIISADVFFLSVTEAYHSNINITGITIRGSAMLFDINMHKTLRIENASLGLYEKKSYQGLYPIFKITSTENVLIQRCNFSTFSEFSISYSVIFTFFKIQSVGMSEILISNYTCPYGESILRFSATSSGMPENFPMVVSIKNFSVVNCSNCENGVLEVLSVKSLVFENLSCLNITAVNQGGFVSLTHVAKAEIFNMKGNSSYCTKGGVLFLKNVSDILIDSSEFLFTRGYDGGVFYFRSVASSLIKNCVFSHIYAVNDGGLLYATSSSIKFQECKIFNSSSQKNGGALSLSKSNITVYKISDAQKFYADSGGFFYCVECLNIEFLEVNVKQSFVINQGSGFYFLDCLSTSFNFVIFSSNKAQSGAGSFYLEGLLTEKVSVNNSVCLNNTALQGACFMFISTSPVTISHTSMERNFGKLIEINSPLPSKRATLNLIAVVITESNTNNPEILPEYLINGQKANMFVMGLFLRANAFRETLIYFSDCEILVENTKFIGESRAYFMGFYPALFEFHNGNIFLNLIEFEGTENREASFLYARNVNLTLKNSIFLRCKTTDWASLIAELSNLTLLNATFLSNSGKRSGAIHVSKSQFNCRKCVFEGNQPLSSDGDIVSNDISIVASQMSTIEDSVFKTSEGLAVFFSESIHLVIKDSEFLASGKYFTKAIYLISSNMTIQNTLFSSFHSDFGGAVLVSNKKKEMINEIHFSNTGFRNCMSPNGGAFFFSGFFTHVRVLKCTFEDNTAYKESQTIKSGTGAVGVYLCLKCNSTTFELKQSLFRYNYAEWFGATIFSQSPISHSEPGEIQSNQFVNNSDALRISTELMFFPIELIYGILKANESDLALSRNTVKQILDSSIFENGAKYISEISSGESLKYLLLITDSLKNSLFLSINLRVKLEVVPIKDIYLAIDQGSSKCETGICLLPLLKINVNQNTTFNISVKLEVTIKELFPYVFEEGITSPLNITLRSRQCQRGELYIEGDKSCYICPKNKYSFANPLLPDQKCFDCPSNGVCLGGDVVVPAKGFWRASKESSLIVECISKDSCLGYREGITKDFVHGDCADNHSGVLCYTCARGYARFSSKDICKVCNKNAFLYLKIIGGLVGVVVYIGIQVHLTLKISSSSHAGILLKQLVNHFQQISLVSLVDLGWTPDIKNYFAIQEYLSFLSEEFITVDCLIDDLNFNLLTKKVVFSNILPIFLSLLTLSFWLLTFYVGYLIKSRRRTIGYQRLFNQIRVSMMIIVYLLFPEILRKCFSLLNCIVVDNYFNTKVLLHSPEIQCWGTEHYSFIFVAAFPGLFCWGFLTPMFILILLCKYKLIIVENIKGIKKLEKMQTQSFEALKVIDKIRLDKVTTESRVSVGAKSLTFLARLPEVQVKEFSKSKVKRNNFFNRKGVQENSDAGLDFFRLNSLNLDSSKLQESTPNIDSEENPTQTKAIGEATPSKGNQKPAPELARLKTNSITFRSPDEAEMKKLNKENGLLLKFLYRGFSSKFYFWEIVMFSKKFFLIFIASFNDFFPSSTKAIVLLVFMAFYIFLQTKFRPFERSYLNQIEFTSLVMTFLTANLGIMLFTDDFKRYSGVFLVLILIFNFSFVILWVLHFFRHVLQSFGVRRFILGLFHMKYSEKKT